MKRTLALAGMFAIAAISLAAAVWDGSAVAGGLGDFPDDGLYGACNSFPHDTSVTVTNLENGKTVTVTITRNVDNPGVFIALSPKAASALGMQAGTSSRIRANALTASQAETSLPPARAGETSDPDYNPKVYVDREKAADAKAAAGLASAPAASEASMAPVAPEASATAAIAPPPVAVASIAPQKTTVVEAPVAEAVPSQSAEVIAKSAEPEKTAAASLPALTEPKPAASPVTREVAKLPADSLPIQEAAPSYPGSPKPAPVNASLPTPDTIAVPAQASPIPRASNIAQGPEVIADNTPEPRRAQAVRLTATDPSLPAESAASEKGEAVAAASTPEKASVVDLAKPGASSTSRAPSTALSLAEPPSPEFAPEELPDAVLSRITSPSKVEPEPQLAEAVPSEKEKGQTGPEAIALEKPSYAKAVEQAALAELQLPGQPSPSESLAADRPTKLFSSKGALSDLDEPTATAPGATGTGPTVVSDLRASPGNAAAATLSDPAVPTPESIASDKPKALEAGQAVASLEEPEAVSPSGQEKAEKSVPDTGTAIPLERPGKAGTATAAELASPSEPSPRESIAEEHPAASAPVEETVTLEPAAPKPPEKPTPAVAETKPAPETSASSEGVAPAAVKAGPKPEAPVTVATVKSVSPTSAAQVPPSVPLIKGLAKGSFYVQIGVYGTNEALQAAVAGFKATYPLAVESMTTNKGGAAYRLFVGPLSRDESGAVLMRIRSLGFKDAYVRQGS
jgi:rare lipoprotein A (peptidoglycan hydrolase)